MSLANTNDTTEQTAEEAAPDHGAALPSRRQLRGELAPLVGRSTPLAVALLLLDIGLYLAALAGALLATSPALKLLSGVACGFVIGRLFIIGHDACHHSYTEHRGLNRWIGRIAYSCRMASQPLSSLFFQLP